MKTHRTRPVRVATKSTKPGVINNPETATLLQWITAYPQTRNPQKAAMWYSRMRFPDTELAEVHALGFEALAVALGYQHHTPLKATSTPYIVSIPDRELKQVFTPSILTDTDTAGKAAA